MVFNATFLQYFSYIVAVSLLVDESGVFGEKHLPVTSHRQTYSYNKFCIEYTSP